ncbi:M1 family aminopeptidase [Hymenobacter sp. BT770]|uniref:ABC transporter permease/M1 family aminopeptidase n=1 Tax=Hymenobacter sp. BT770 TaxID=2886942 RepID=UPI001D100946|nr:M1 family aminopeptidase [Hymenobacter sp. BT770]MCC3152465.1 ABC transporter permease [Hymenobacter sp. BT770]MDO3414559.1 M1 family aminopeptidase [Hymenobacter sp. BT770]
MKFQRIFALEFSYQLRQVATWLYFGVILLITFLVVIANFASDARDGYILLNAPIVMAAVTVICCVFWLVIGASVAGEAAARDVQTRMHLLTYAAPASKAAYLGGRYLAALALSAFQLLAIPVGMLLAMHFAGVEAEILGPFRVAPYLTTFFFIALPNAFFATAMQFSAAALSRRALASYLVGAVLFAAAYTIWPLLEKGGEWGNLADPMSFGPVLSHLSTDWSPQEKSTRFLLLEGSFLANRLLWFGISLGLLAFTYFRFQFVLPGTGQKQQSGKPLPAAVTAWEKLNWGTGEALPQAKRTYGLVTQLRQLRLITWESFLQLAKSKAGLPLLAVLALLVGATVPGNLKGRGVPLLPRTDFVLDYLTGPLAQPERFWILIALLTIFYAGELVWREREAGLSEIANSAPVPEWVLFLSRFLALSLVLVVWLAFLMTAGMVAQVAIGGATPEIGLYLQTLFGLQLVDCLLFALLALLVHALVNQKFVGHLVALVAYGFIAFAPSLGIAHKLLLFGASPPWTYTNMAGFGSSLGPWLWFKGYWVAWALLLAVVARLFWVRGREGSVAARLQLARRRFTGSTVGVSAAAFAGIFLFGGFIFYNTNVLHDYLSAAETTAQRAAYEQLYRRYLNVPQPLLTGVNLRVEIYPQQRAVDIRGSYLLVNNSPSPIDSIHLATGAGVETAAVHFDRPFKQVHRDAEHGYHMYALTRPLRPGDSLRLSFQVTHQARGFSNSGADAQVLANGTSFRNLEWLPVLGYQPYRELDEAGARKAYGLAARPATYSLYDVAARRYAPFPEQIRLEAIVGTDVNQTVVAPGTLRRTWTKAGRRYFHYATDAPIRNEYAFFSANYAVQEGKWRNPSAPDKEVAIQVYYPPGLKENPARMVRSAQASLDHYTKQFGPYPYRQLRFVAHPSYAFGHHAAPINITAEEGFFLLNPKDDKRGFDLVTAVVAHEVAHQWWGNQLKQAYVAGAGLITESLAWYSAMGVLEDNYGPEHLQALLRFLREENETPRTRAAKPLLQADDFYQNYRKGPLALYALSQYIGRDRINGALRNLLARHRPGALPFATSLDLYRELQTATPDSLQPLLHDLFEANTFWELAAETATARQLKGGAWQVTLNLKASKLVVDSAGTETKRPMKEWVEIGVFAPGEAGKELGKALHLQKHLIKSGQQTILLTVPGRPSKVGVDPRNLLIDWKVEDNFKVVKLIK